jgi:glucose-6-phosphate isomerase
MENINPSGTVAWQQLREHFQEMQYASMKEMFAADKGRAEKFHIAWNDFVVDYSKNIINNTTLKLLTDLVTEAGLQQAIKSYFEGEAINRTEGRAVLHTALRAPENAVIKVDGENIIPEVYSVKNKMRQFSEEIIQGARKGYTGKAFTDIMNIGIGGSDLGLIWLLKRLNFIKTISM